MKRSPQALVALDAQVDREMVEALLSVGRELDVLDYVELEGHEPGRDGAGDVLVVACSDYTAAVGDYVSAASREHPARPVVLLCPGAANGYVAEAFGAGADDIVPLPRDCDTSLATSFSHQVLFTLEKAIARKKGQPADTDQQLGRLICVLGLKGGSGKTLTSSNLAAALGAAGHRVVIVDLDLQFGDVGLTLGLSPDKTLYDLARSGGSLDVEKLDSFLVEHPSGARALLAPVRPDQAGIVTVDALREVYPLLREMHDFVVIDTPPSFTPEVIAAVDSSTDVCVVAMLDSLSLKNTKVGLETLARMEYDHTRIRMVLNRADSKVGIDAGDVMSIIGREPDVLVPSDRMVTRSVNAGEPIALKHRRSEAGKAFHALANLYAGDLASANGTGANGNGKPARRASRRES
ncbi:MAG: pilus assembly protein CpaE [Solirubrobacteraceae bacterium]|nr:pilus assembly protein CpaE [Solirubrobacteraceae bacterium]